MLGRFGYKKHAAVVFGTKSPTNLGNWTPKDLHALMSMGSFSLRLEGV